MATMITEECINCGACEPECPNTAIYAGGVQYEFNGQMSDALSNDFYYIVPEKCTECVGHFDQEQCAAVCPVDCCVPDPNRVESEEVLLAAREGAPSGQGFPGVERVDVALPQGLIALSGDADVTRGRLLLDHGKPTFCFFSGGSMMPSVSIDCTPSRPEASRWTAEPCSAWCPARCGGRRTRRMTATGSRWPLARCSSAGDGRTILVDTGNGTKYSDKLRVIYAIDSGKHDICDLAAGARCGPGRRHRRHPHPSPFRPCRGIHRQGRRSRGARLSRTPCTTSRRITGRPPSTRPSATARASSRMTTSR